MQKIYQLIARVLMALVMVSGCRSDTILQTTVQDPTEAFWRLVVNHSAVVLSVHAPYNTVQLSAVPENIYGDVIPTTATARYRNILSIDTSVRVSEDGLITAIAARTASRIEVMLTVNGITQFDTAVVMVRNEFPVRLVDSIVVRPGPSDSTHRWAGLLNGFYQRPWRQWLRIFKNDGSSSAAQYPVRYFVDDDCIVTSCSLSSAMVVGETYVRAKLYAYGQTFSDSVLIRNVEPDLKLISIKQNAPVHSTPTVVFYPSELTVRSGATVVFGNLGPWRTGESAEVAIGNDLNPSKQITVYSDGSWLVGVAPVDIVFEDPTYVMAGNAYEGIIWGCQFAGLCSALQNWGDYPSDGLSGNVEAFGATQCRSLKSVWEPGELFCGGISLFTGDTGIRSRKFVRPGVYRYHSTRFPGAGGIIHVKE